ncbi:MAG: short-chain dehydrogenase/reductase [Labilithrix sp.]|nr:short-chain dehydrogenase/reductase [Labilithrix sp.]
MKNDKVWFITGASKGLGLSLARRVLREGGRVAATSRSRKALIAALGEQSASLLSLEVDLLDAGSVRDAVAATLGHFGALDVVVNNAGYGQLGTIEELSDAETRKNFDVNVFGLLNVLRAVLPHLREKRTGHIFDISSIAGFVGGFSGWGIYVATKFAVAGITESLHADLAEHGVHVTLVYPGYFRTAFLEQGSLALPESPIAAYAAARASHAQHVEEINSRQPGDPERLAGVLVETAASASPPLHLFLGSDAFAMATQKLDGLRAELARHEAVSRSTDFA